MFGRATITLGIGPHSSLLNFTKCDITTFVFLTILSDWAGQLLL